MSEIKNKIMIKSFTVDINSNNMRLDRLLRNKLGKIPQSLIEKDLRNGKIKVNKKKIKSSYKLIKNDKIYLYNFSYKNLSIDKKKIYTKKKK